MRNPMRLCTSTLFVVGYAAAGCGSAADAPGEVPAEPPVAAVSEALADPPVSPEATKLFELGGKIAGAFTGVTGALDTIKGLTSLLGMDDTPTLESQIASQFERANQKLDALLNEVGGVSFQFTYSQIAPPLSQLRAHAEDARAAVKRTGAPFVAPPDLLSTSKGWVYAVMDDSVFWRTYATKLTDGEWKAAIGEPAVEIHDFRTWDYRVGLPALMEAISYRLIILGSVDPGFASSPVYRDELTLYRDTLGRILTKIEGGIVCNFGVSANLKARASRATFCTSTIGFDSQAYCGYDVTYTLDAFCADPFTGAYTKLSKTAPVLTTQIYDAPACFSGSGFCPDRSMGVNEHVRLMDSWNIAYYPSVQVDVLDQFWSAAPTNPAFSDLIANGLDDARAQLRVNLGLFGVRRTIDSLSMMVTGDRGPVWGGQLRSAYDNRCLSAAGDAAGIGARAVIAECDRPAARSAESFRYDPVSAQLHNTAYGTCLDVQNGSSRRGTPAWYWGCWPSVTDPRSNAQRWSYDPVTRQMRNALGRSLDVYNGDSSPGNGLWTYDENASPAQKWGYAPPWFIAR